MLKRDFERFKPYFSEKEQWGDLAKVEWYHVHHLYLIRERLKKDGRDWPMIIHCCHATDGHAKKSYHYKGLATDFHFKTKEGIVSQYIWLDQVLNDLNLRSFMGVGIYPGWKPIPGGFHIDSRGEYLRWVNIKGIYYYFKEKEQDDLLTAINEIWG